MLDEGAECLLVSPDITGRMRSSPQGRDLMSSEPEMIHRERDRGKFRHYSPETDSDSGLEDVRSKAVFEKRRTRLGYQRLSIACCTALQIAFLTSSVLL